MLNFVLIEIFQYWWNKFKHGEIILFDHIKLYQGELHLDGGCWLRHPWMMNHFFSIIIRIFLCSTAGAPQCNAEHFSTLNTEISSSVKTRFLLDDPNNPSWRVLVFWCRSNKNTFLSAGFYLVNNFSLLPIYKFYQLWSPKTLFGENYKIIQCTIKSTSRSFNLKISSG